MKAPKLCPPAPVHLTAKVSSSKPVPYLFVISEPKIVPNARSGVRHFHINASAAVCLQVQSRSCFHRVPSRLLIFSSSKSYTCFGSKVTFSFGPAYGLSKILRKDQWLASHVRSDLPGLQAGRFVLPAHPRVLQPSFAMYSRSSSAINFIKFSTYSGFPAKRFLNSGFCVAMPAGQVSRVTDTHHDTSHGYQAEPLQIRIPLHPECAAIATSRPLIKLSVCLNTDFISQTVHDQSLMCLGKSKLPWKSCIVDGTCRSCTGTSIITGDQNNLCACFCNTCCDGTNTCL